MSAERDFARRCVAGMLRASLDQLEPAWRLDPVWGTWEPNAPPAMTCRALDANIRAMPTGELLSALQSSFPQTNGEQAS